MKYWFAIGAVVSALTLIFRFLPLHERENVLHKWLSSEKICIYASWIKLTTTSIKLEVRLQVFPRGWPVPDQCPMAHPQHSPVLPM